MKDAEVIKKILNRIGQEVEMIYPGIIDHVRGVLKDRMVTYSTSDQTGVKYWDVIDLIEFPNASQKEHIRIGYYRQKGERLVWGSQTTITEPISTWKKLLVQAAKEKPWFRELLGEVMREIE